MNYQLSRGLDSQFLLLRFLSFIEATYFSNFKEQINCGSVSFHLYNKKPFVNVLFNKRFLYIYI